MPFFGENRPEFVRAEQPAPTSAIKCPMSKLEKKVSGIVEFSIPDIWFSLTLIYCILFTVQFPQALNVTKTCVPDGYICLNSSNLKFNVPDNTMLVEN